MTYDIDSLAQSLSKYGELIVTLESGNTVELHLHDTTLVEGDEDTNAEVVVDLTDGGFAFTPDRIESVAFHTQGTEDVL